MTSRQGDLRQGPPGFAVVMGNAFEAVQSQTGIFPHKRRNGAAAQGDKRNFAELIAGIVGNKDFIAPCFAVVIRLAQELGKVPLITVMRRRKIPSVWQNADLIRHDAAQREDFRSTPCFAVV